MNTDKFGGNTRQTTTNLDAPDFEKADRSRLSEKLKKAGFTEGLSLLKHTPEEALQGAQTRETFTAVLKAMSADRELDASQLLPKTARIEDIPESMERNDESVIKLVCDSINGLKSFLQFHGLEASPEEMLQKKLQQRALTSNFNINVSYGKHPKISSKQADKNCHIISPPILLPKPFNEGYEVLIVRTENSNVYLVYILTINESEQLRTETENRIEDAEREILQAQRTAKIEVDQTISDNKTQKLSTEFKKPPTQQRKVEIDDNPTRYFKVPADLIENGKTNFYQKDNGNNGNGRKRKRELLRKLLGMDS